MQQLPNDVERVGLKEVRPFHHEDVYYSKSKNFTGTGDEFVKAGHGYNFICLSDTRRLVI